MALPIYIQARALAQGKASLDEIWTNLKEQAEETGVYALLVDDEGNILRWAAPEYATVKPLTKFPEGTLPDDLSETYRGTFSAPKRQTFVFVAYPLAPLFGTQNPSAPEVLILAAPRASALGLLVSLARPFLGAGIITFIVSLLVAFLLARSIYRPIQQVTKAAEAIAQGKYDQEIIPTGPPEAKGLAAAFNHMARQVKLSQQRLRNFLSDVSHELRTPLTSIRGFAQAMVDGTIKDKEAESRAAQIIEDESKRMIRLVDELLELSRIESGQAKMSREPVDMKALLQHCQEIFTMRAQEKGLKLSANLEPLPTVTGDADRLEQVFCNLLDNALKHTPSGGAITIRARQASPGLAEISVSDTGKGIPHEQLPHIFERFYRADTSEAQSGTGLGLAIAREIAKAHGGDIEARNKPGEGAEFIVRLPSGSRPTN
jgi:signal transduction histidine kinase